VALLMAAPALMGTIGVVVLGGYRLLQPSAFLFADPPPPSLADAIRSREVEAAYAFVHAGTDPNARVPFRDEALTGGRAVMTSPLMVSVGVGNGSAALMLLAFGARLDLPQNAGAVCLARDLGNEELFEALVRDGGLPSTPSCTPPVPGAAPLLRYVESPATR
jgi:hypothetical protein